MLEVQRGPGGHLGVFKNKLMCGICGKIAHGARANERVSPELLGAMTSQMVHRGPDDDGTLLRHYPDYSVGLGHRRLSIIDLSTAGRQPLSNETGTVWVLLNGEIYNFAELRSQLEGKGHQFSSRTDSEVIVHLYEDYGEGAVKKLRGMFALAIWDEERGRLLLARDRLGKKPLFYSEGPGHFLFASELNALMEDPSISSELDWASLADYLALSYIPIPRSIFRSVRKLPPAHFLLWEKGRVSLQRYWTVDNSPKWIASEEEYIEGILEALRESTRLRLVSDVPLGALLSGGIDSSAVVATMAGLMDRPVKTFSIGFEVDVFNELPHARRIAERFGTDHHEFVVRPDAVEVLPQIVRHFGEPFADSSALPTYYLAKMTREHVTVALNGDAGDETFGGYERYVALGLAHRFDRLPLSVRQGLCLALRPVLGNSLKEKGLRRRLRRFLDALPLSSAGRYLRWMSIAQEELRPHLYSPSLLGAWESEGRGHPLADGYESLVEAPEIENLAEGAMRLDLVTYLPNDLLVKMDIMTMAHALEARSPFLDHKFVELAASIPSRFKVRGRQTKYILKRALASLLPPDIIHRGKMGFGVPLARWFRSELKEYAREVLLDPASLRRGYFQPSAVEALLRQHALEEEDHGYLIWSLLVLELWHREVLEGRVRGVPQKGKMA